MIDGGFSMDCVPGVGTGIGPPDWLGHAPNEFITLSHFTNGIHYAVNIWAALGSLPS